MVTTTISIPPTSTGKRLEVDSALIGLVGDASPASLRRRGINGCLSIRQGFATDHSTVAYRYTAPDKTTTWRTFREGLPDRCRFSDQPSNF